MMKQNDAQKKTITLEDLQPGDEAIISGYSEEIADELRLLEMGLIIGSAVRMIRRAPLGDPLQIRIRGFDLSLRRNVARGILATPTHLK